MRWTVRGNKFLYILWCSFMHVRERILYSICLETGNQCSDQLRAEPKA